LESDAIQICCFFHYDYNKQEQHIPVTSCIDEHMFSFREVREGLSKPSDHHTEREVWCAVACLVRNYCWTVLQYGIYL